MFRLLLALSTLLSSFAVMSDCNEYALQGTWTVYYRDNAFPTSVLAPGKTIDIQYSEELDQFSLDFTDGRWKAWGGGWAHECIDGQAVLIGAIAQRRGKVKMVVEIRKVIDVADLLARPSGEMRLEQINIQFPRSFASTDLDDAFDALKREGYLASHPGHAHGDK